MVDIETSLDLCGLPVVRIAIGKFLDLWRLNRDEVVYGGKILRYNYRLVERLGVQVRGQFVKNYTATGIELRFSVSDNKETELKIHVTRER